MNYEERDKKIEARIKDKDLSINVSWAINNATQIITATYGNAKEEEKEMTTEQVMFGVETFANHYLELYQKLREQQARKQIEKEEAPEDVSNMKTADKLNL